MMALLAPLTVSAAKPESKSPANNIEIITKSGTKGITPMGPPMRGTKPVASTGVIGAGGGTGYAVVVGIADYPGPLDVYNEGLDLYYPDDDAQLMAYALWAKYGYQPQNITLLTDQAASRTAVLDAIAEMAAKAGPDDEVVFFFSGHAVKLTGNGKGGGNVGILTWGMETPYGDFPEVITDKELKAAFETFQTDRQVFIFDSCVGAAFNEIGGEGSVLIAASGQAGTAAEDLPPDSPYNAGMNHGLFTFFLVQYGILGGYADLNGDGAVTIEEAYDFARFNLEQMSQAGLGLWQIPAISDQFENDLLLGAQ
jgi:hypothetical protein